MLSECSILNNINKITKNSFVLSKVINDEYLLNQEQKIIANGYGVYDDKIFAKHRYCLIVNLNNKGAKDTIVALLMNPSDTFPKGLNNKEKSKFDQTIRNIIKLVNMLGYKQLIIVNSFSYICSNGKEAFEYYEKKYINSNEEKINKAIIEYIFGLSNELIIACGDGISKNLYESYVNLIKYYMDKNDLILLTYANKLTNKHRPRHFSLQAEKNREYFKEALNNKKLLQLEIKDNIIQYYS